MFGRVMLISYSIILTSILVVASSVAQAGFLVSEYGEGESVTGTISASLLTLNEFAPLADDDLSSLITAIQTTGSATVFPPDAAIFDRNADGIITNAEVVQALGVTDGVDFSASNPQQAAAILIHIDACATIDDACLKGAASAGKTFLDTALSNKRSTLATAAVAIANGSSSLPTSSYLDIGIFDTDYDGSITTTEIVDLIATDPNLTEAVIQPSGDAGLYARAYIQELASGLTLAQAVKTGNDWAVHPPAFKKTSASTTLRLERATGASTANYLPAGMRSALRVTDGTCIPQSVNTCSPAPTAVTHKVTATYTNPSGTATAVVGNPFTVDSTGNVVLNQKADIGNLAIGTYNLKIVSTDTNSTDTYNRSSTANLALVIIPQTQNTCNDWTPTFGADDFDNLSGNIKDAKIRFLSFTWPSPGSRNNMILPPGTIVGPMIGVFNYALGSSFSNGRPNAYAKVINIDNPGSASLIIGRYYYTTGELHLFGNKSFSDWIKVLDAVTILQPDGGYVLTASNIPKKKFKVEFSLAGKIETRTFYYDQAVASIPLPIKYRPSYYRIPGNSTPEHDPSNSTTYTLPGKFCDF